MEITTSPGCDRGEHGVLAHRVRLDGLQAAEAAGELGQALLRAPGEHRPLAVGDEPLGDQAPGVPGGPEDDDPC